ncbi:MAG TPA: fatty acid--CoA ligase family protein [Acidimicrobiia bacterium]|nr:fatty acid--CoA ligase family protein [Acidimicrobiia bacterium]
MARSEIEADGSMPLRHDSVGAALRRAAAAAPDGLALVEGQPDPERRRRWTFTELLADAERMARALATRFEPGEHAAVWASSTPEWVILDRGGAYLNCMPLFHTGGCVLGVLGPIQRLATCVCLREFDPALMLDLCEAERVTHFLAVPTMLVALLAEQARKERDLSSLRLICSGAAPVPTELVRRVQREFGVEFSILFGQTEAAPVITMTRPDDAPEDIAGTFGTAIPQVAVKVVDPATGDTVPVGQPGELCAKGFMIIRAGENIYPVEIEEVVFRHPGVAEVAVVGLPDETSGEIVAAFIRDADPARPVGDAELRAHVREHLAPHKTPAVWVHLEAFPLTPSGKVQKFALRDAWPARSAAAAGAP